MLVLRRRLLLRRRVELLVAAAVRAAARERRHAAAALVVLHPAAAGSREKAEIHTFFLLGQVEDAAAVAVAAGSREPDHRRGARSSPNLGIRYPEIPAA